VIAALTNTGEVVTCGGLLSILCDWRLSMWSKYRANIWWHTSRTCIQHFTQHTWCIHNKIRYKSTS